MIQANVHKGLDLFEMLVKRERRKRDLVVRGLAGGVLGRMVAVGGTGWEWHRVGTERGWG